MTNSDAYLTLENGQVFSAKRFGADGDVTAELVFNTSMTGYIETLTDPSYYGQLVVQCFPLIGNVGIIDEDFESLKPHLTGYIVREWCRRPSNYRMNGLLDTFLKQGTVIGLEGVDTRALTKIIRNHGVMNAHISDNPNLSEETRDAIHNFRITDALLHVTCEKPQFFKSTAPISSHHVVLIDYGAKLNITRELLRRGCDVTVVPATTSYEEILGLNPDGIMLSNGPGDPADHTDAVRILKSLLETGIPMFGICLGHQMIALSFGGKSAKLKYGHRGANQPVMNLDSRRTYITGQNHGYYILNEGLPSFGRINYINTNDDTCEGITYDPYPIFSVQYHPEASGGPLDNMYLFDEFIKLMEEKK
jgi:carbamoyl-phosphate synthase small subunit